MAGNPRRRPSLTGPMAGLSLASCRVGITTRSIDYIHIFYFCIVFHLDILNLVTSVEADNISKSVVDPGNNDSDLASGDMWQEGGRAT